MPRATVWPPRASCQRSVVRAAFTSVTVQVTFGFFFFVLTVHFTRASRPGGPASPFGPAAPVAPVGPVVPFVPFVPFVPSLPLLPFAPFAPSVPLCPAGRALPLPASGTARASGLLPPTESTPERAPCASGAKRTWTVQDSQGSTKPPQVFAPTSHSSGLAPVTAKPSTASAARPRLVNVTVLGPLIVFCG